MKTRRNSESGAAMVLVLTVMAALLAAGSVALLLQVNASKSSNLVASSKRALFCAEAGLQASRTFIVANKSSWTLMLDTDAGNDPVGYPVTGDFDGDGDDDWRVTIRDDDDDVGDDPTVDENDRVFIVSECIKYPEFPVMLAELIELAQSSGKCTNRLQKGGCASKGGNQNVEAAP